ncbi:MAG: hypothetical protein K0S61_207 [Anaerocolumna sp.]|jgi:hypothetical protein|nr:hypothetical protein [Anaerocolumna sp.]
MAQNKQNAKNSAKDVTTKNKAESLKESTSRSSSWSSVKPDEDGDDRERRDGPGGN